MSDYLKRLRESSELRVYARQRRDLKAKKSEVTPEPTEKEATTDAPNH